MASKNIQGITIEFDGDTSKLGVALRDINKEIKDVDKQIRAVDQALRLDPKNAEKVAEKIELLSEKSELAEKKVQALKEAQKKMDADGVDKNSEAYKELTNEIVKAEGQYKKLTTQIERTESDFEDLCKSSKELETYLKATGKSADDLEGIIGKNLVDAYKSGSMSLKQYETALQKLSTETTGSRKNFEDFKKILDSVDDNADFSKIKSELDQLASKAKSSKTDVSGLGTEFDTLNTKSSSIAKELKAVNESLKLDPSNIEIVAQKQDLLSQAVSTTEEKLKVLKTRYDDFKNGKLDLGEEEFRELQREISNTESSLSSYRSELSDLENAQQRLNTYFEATGTSVKDFANVLGSELTSKIERGEASSKELSDAVDKIGRSAVGAKGDINQFKSELDSVHSAADLDRVSREFNDVGYSANEAEDDVDKLAESLDKLNEKAELSNIMEAADTLGDFGDKLKDVAGSALEASESVTESTNAFKIGLGMSAEEAERFAGIAREVFANNFGQSLDDVTEKTVYFSQVMGDLVDEADISDLVSQFITLDDAGMDYNETIRGVKNMMVSFGISAQEATDLMAKGMQNGLNFTDELGDNIAEYSPRWAEAGVSASQYFSLLEAGCEAGGYQLDKVGDFLNEFITSLQDGRIEENIGNFTEGTQELFAAWQDGKADTMDVFDAIIGELKDMDDQTQAATLSGQIWSALGEDNAQGMIQALANVPDSYQDISGAAQQAADDNSNASSQMSRSWENFKLSLAPIGDQLAKIATKILDAVTPIIEGISKGFSSLPEPIQTFIVAFGGIVAAIAVVVPVIAGLVSAWGVLSTAITGILTPIAALMGIGLGPLIGIIAGVVAAIAALIAIFTNWDEICSWFSEVWGNFSEWIGEAWDNACSYVSDAWNNLWTGLGDFFSSVGQGVLDTLSSWGTSLGEGVESIKSSIHEKWQSMCDGLGRWWDTTCKNVSSTYDKLKSGLLSASDNIKSNISNAWETIKSNTSNTWENIKDKCSSIWDTMKTNQQTKFDFMKQAISVAWDNIKSNTSQIWDNIKSNLDNTYENLRSNTQSKFNEIKDNISQAWENVKSNTSQTWENIKSETSNAWENLKSTVANAAQNLVDSVWNAISSIPNKFNEIWENAKNIVANAINALINMMNFNWELPRIKLPHFSISGSFSLNPPSVPSIGIDWYAKGGILTSPTIFGANGSSLLGGGEAGKEAVLPLDSFYKELDDRFDRSNDETNSLLRSLISIIKENNELLKNSGDTQIVLEDGTLVGSLTPKINQELGRLYNRGIRQ